MGCNNSAMASPSGGSPGSVTLEGDCAKYYSQESETKITDLYDVDFKKKLGKGHYAVVFPAVDKRNTRKVAVKRINKSKSRKDRLKLEVNILRKVGGHPHIVRLYDVFDTPKDLYLVMELVTGGELFDHLVSKGPYSEKVASSHMQAVASAVEYLHSKNIVHRDLKPENLLLTSRSDKTAQVKVADFGLAKLTDGGVLKTVCGTWAYCAPEVKSASHKYGPKVDVWSMGVIMFVILVAFHPFDPDGVYSDATMWSKITKCEFNFKDPAWKSMSNEAKDLIKRCIVLKVSKRYSATDILRHKWISGKDYEPTSTPISPCIDKNLGTFRSKGVGSSFYTPQTTQADDIMKELC